MPSLKNAPHRSMSLKPQQRILFLSFEHTVLITPRSPSTFKATHLVPLRTHKIAWARLLSHLWARTRWATILSSMGFKRAARVLITES